MEEQDEKVVNAVCHFISGLIARSDSETLVGHVVDVAKASKQHDVLHM